jgi:hypothetical protein
MSSTISGNVASFTSNEIVYIQETQGQALSPMTTQVDGSGNYTFSGLSQGTYILYTAGNLFPTGAPRAAIEVIVDGVNNAANVNFAK